jgi:hypothetical protein
MLTNFNVVLTPCSVFVVEDTSHLFLVESSLTLLDRGHVAWHLRARLQCKHSQNINYSSG